MCFSKFSCTSAIYFISSVGICCCCCSKTVGKTMSGVSLSTFSPAPKTVRETEIWDHVQDLHIVVLSLSTVCQRLSQEEVPLDLLPCWLLRVKHWRLAHLVLLAFPLHISQAHHVLPTPLPLFLSSL